MEDGDDIDITETGGEDESGIELGDDDIEISGDEIGVVLEGHFTSSEEISINEDFFGNEIIELDELTEADRENAVTPENISESLNESIENILSDNELSDEVKTGMIIENTDKAFSRISLSEELSIEEKVDAMQKVYASMRPEARQEVTVPARAEFLNEKNPFDRFGRPNYLWSEEMGFDGKPQQVELQKGMTLDRYGSGFGNYVCEVKNGIPQEYNSRALPYVENPEMYHQYEVVKDLTDFNQRMYNLSVEEIKNIELQKDMQKPEEERRTEEQITKDAQNRYINIQWDVQNSINRMNQTAKDNGWNVNYQEPTALSGQIKESFSYVDEKGNEVKLGGGEQIALPASVDTLIYLGYLEEKHD